MASLRVSEANHCRESNPMTYGQGRLSQTCRAKRAPYKPLAEYESEAAAWAAADHVSAKTGKRFVPRSCATCRLFHIQPAPELCPECRSGRGEAKHVYRTSAAAHEAATACGGALRVYECPVGYGYHLTKT